MQLEQRINFIKQNLLVRGGYGYTLAAKECVGLIEDALRELLLNHANSLDADTQAKIQNCAQTSIKQSRAKSIQDFTLGQLIGVLRDSDFINAWEKIHNNEAFLSFKLLNLDELARLRNLLIHNKQEVSHNQALFLYRSLQLLVESFGIASLEKVDLSMPLPESRNPYVGLMPFTEKDRAYFYGRTQAIVDLKSLLEQQNFVALLGNSGSGKSSVLLAGLIPTLKNHNWLCLVCRPQNMAIYQLAAMLIDGIYYDSSNEITEISRLREIDELSRILHSNPQFIHSPVHRIQNKNPNIRHILLAIDQFEELYTLNQIEIQQVFIKNILKLLNISQQVHLLINLRTDFLPLALDNPDFAHLFDSQRNKLLGKLNKDELREAILLPAKKYGVEFDKGLYKRILHDLSKYNAQLPLLQFTLQKLWENHKGRYISHADYEILGGVSKAISLHADNVYSGLNDQAKAILRKLLIQLVQPGMGIEDTRKILPLNYFTEPEQKQIIQHLISERLLTTNENNIEIIHEALLHHWQPLRNWLTEDRQFRLWQEGLRHYLRDKMLLSGAALATAQEWLAQRPTEIQPKERQLIEHSLANIAAAQAEREQQAALIAQHLREMLITQSLFLADLARQHVEQAQPMTAMRLALEALPQFSTTHPERPLVSQAYHSLLAALNQHYQGILQHEQAVKAAIFSPDGTMLLTYCANIAYIWITINRKLHAMLNYHHDFITSAIFSPDSKQIITTAADNKACLWQTDNGKLLTTMEHEATVINANFSYDSQYILTTSADKTIKIWQNETLLLTLAEHKDAVQAASFSPDGQRIISIAGDTAYLWEVCSGKNLALLTGHQDKLRSAVFSPDGNLLVTSAWDKTARIWDGNNGKLISILTGHEYWLNVAIFSPDGQYILTASSDKTAKLWRINDSKIIINFVGHTDIITSAVFSADGKYILTASWDKTAKIWDSYSGKLVHELIGHKDWLATAVFSFDGYYVLTASNDKTARLWHTQTGKNLTIFATSAIKAANCSYDTKYLLTSNNDNVLNIWNTESANLYKSFVAHNNLLTTANFNAQADLLVTASMDKTAKIWSVSKGELLHKLTGHQDRLILAVFSHNNKLILTASWDNTARIWDANNGKLQHILANHKDKLTAAAFSPDDLYVITASQDNTAKIWASTNGELLVTLSGHTDWLNAASFNFDASLALTAADDNTARLWQVNSGELILPPLLHQAKISSAVFSADGKYILTASWDKTAKIWDINNGKLIYNLSGHNGILYAAEFAPDGKVVTASADNTARIWHNGNWLATLHGHQAAVTAAKFTPDSKHIITTSLDKTARLWLAADLAQLFDLANDFLPARLESSAYISPTALSHAEREQFFLSVKS
jgi:WD40 repeat protein/energy-coupling factor transporter ATP-binding protein EcfA2